jgi:hypothetical protein
MVYLRNLVKSPALLIFSLFLFLQGIDISKDFASVGGIALKSLATDWNAMLEPLHVYTLAAFLLALVLSILFADKIIFPSQVGKFIFCLFLFISVGFYVGLLGKNIFNFLLLETSNWLIYIALPLFVSLSMRNGFWRNIFAALTLFFILIAMKVYAGFIIDFAANITYLRIIVKSNFIFMPYFFIALSMAVLAGKRSYWLMTAFMILTLLITGMRGYYIGVAAGGIFYLTFFVRGKNIIQIGRMAGVALLSFGLLGSFLYFTELSPSQAAGFWGDTLQEGAQFRMRQFDFLLSEFAGSPLWGKGFGLVLKDFEGFEAWLPKPYLQELEWINFLAKTGIVGIAALLSAFAFLLGWMKDVSGKAKTREQSAIVQGLACGLVAILAASFFNTLISSLIFHLYVIATAGITAGIACESNENEFPVRA